MGLREAFSRLAEHVGMDDDDIQALLGDESEVVIRDLPSVDLDLDQPLAGSFGDDGDAFEIFFSDSSTPLEQKGSDLLWYPMIREGQWAVRPGPAGQKKKSPLKVVAGKSKNQRKEIGLEDLVAAFNDGAVEYVTVPETHDNKTLENTGFIRGMKIAKAPIQTGPKKGEMAATLFGGYHFTDKKAKGKVKEGSVAGRSCGILYDYVNTETGKSYPAVIEHVCLTNKPWITGMLPFGRKLSGVEGLSWDAMRLSDEEPSAEIVDDVEALSDWAEREGLRLAKETTAVTWTHEDSPNWMRQQVDEILREAREEKRKARSSNGNASYVEDLPYYRCIEAKPGKALICDGYGEGANHWVADFKITDGVVELEDFDQWEAVKSVFIPDPRDAPPKNKEPLTETFPDPFPARDESPRGRLALAQEERRRRAQAEDNLSQTTTHPRGGGKTMDENEKNNGGLQLSEEAKAQIAAAEARATAAEKRAEKLEGTVDRLNSSVVERDSESYIQELKDMGLDEEHGFSGALAYLRDVFVADDGGEAVVSEKFSEDGKSEVALSVTDAFKGFFAAIKKGEDGKIALGEQITEPAEGEETKENKEGEGGEAGNGVKASTEGKPAKDGENGEELSLDEKVQGIGDDNPELAKLIGVTPGASAAGADNGNGGGESK